MNLPDINGSLALDFAIGGDLYEHQQYYLNMERVLVSTKEWRIAGLKKRSLKLMPHIRQEFLENNYPYRWGISFPNQLRSCAIISAMSFLESVLIGLCKEAEIRFPSTFTEPKNGGRLECCRGFLGNTGGLRSLSKGEWRPVANLIALRNELIHKGMRINSAEIRPTNRKKIEQLPGAEFDEDGLMVIGAQLCEFTYGVVERVLQILRDEITQKWEGEN